MEIGDWEKLKIYEDMEIELKKLPLLTVRARKAFILGGAEGIIG